MSFYYLKHLRGEIIFLNNILRKYICVHLISWSPNHSYYLRQYNLATKLMLACDQKKARSLLALAKRGEAICGGKLVNFYEDEKHKKCSCSTA